MVIFVAGIDTDIGKTYAVGLLARYLMERGKKVITQKIVQTGCVGQSDDILIHRKLMGCGELPEDREGLTCPYLFAFPASPHYAAKREGREIDPAVIDRATRTLEERYDVVLLEGAGGLCVPLTPDLMTIDYFANLEYPLILVTSGRLGSLNHTFLAIEAAERRRVPLAGLIFNQVPRCDEEIAADSRAVLLHELELLGYPKRLVDLPEVKFDGNDSTPDFSVLFEGLI